MLNFIRNLIRKRCVAYALVEKKIGDVFVQGVRITAGKYSGLVFTTSSQVKFKVEDGGEVKLDYQYKIEYKPESISIDDIAPEKLDKIVGDIILDIVEKNLDKPD